MNLSPSPSVASSASESIPDDGEIDDSGSDADVAEEDLEAEEAEAQEEEGEEEEEEAELEEEKDGSEFEDEPPLKRKRGDAEKRGGAGGKSTLVRRRQGWRWVM